MSDRERHPHASRDPLHPWLHPDLRLPIDPDLSPDDPGEPSSSHHPTAHVHRTRQHLVLAAIALGGFVGAWGRDEVSLTWRTTSGDIPWTTFAINTSGAFMLGLILTVLLNRSRPANYLRPFLGVGVLGAWTTMSTFAMESDLLVKDGDIAAAVAYAAATVGLGLIVTWAGIMAGRALVRGLLARWV